MRAERRDANEPEIVAALRAIGCRTWSLCAAEPADQLVYVPNAQWRSYAEAGLFLLEIKEGKARLTPTQKRTHAEWPIRIARTVDDALDLVWAAKGRIRRPM